VGASIRLTLKFVINSPETGVDYAFFRRKVFPEECQRDERVLVLQRVNSFEILCCSGAVGSAYEPHHICAGLDLLHSGGERSRPLRTGYGVITSFIAGGSRAGATDDFCPAVENGHQIETAVCVRKVQDIGTP